MLRVFCAVLLALFIALPAAAPFAAADTGGQVFASEEGGDPGGDPGGGNGGDPGTDPGGGNGGDPGTEPGGGNGEGGEEEGGGGGEDPPPFVTVGAIAIGYAGVESGHEISTTSVYGSNTGTIQITGKGQSVSFDNLVYWVNYSYERNLHFVTWSTSDAAVATVSPSGVLTPLRDGTVELCATVPGSYVEGGAELAARVRVEIFGQADAPYITGIRIVDAAGQGYDIGAPYVLEAQLATALAQFYAEVDVFYPDTQETRYYTTKGTDGGYSKLSTLVPELSDLTWSTSEVTIAAITDTGLFRALRYGVSFITVETRATLDNSRLAATAVISVEDPTGVGEESYNPQSSLTVKAYYENYKPDVWGDAAYVVNETFSVADIRGMGLFSATYTALGGSGTYYTMTGRGVPFATVLRESGISDISKVRGFTFGAADSYGQLLLSRDYIFKDRYYYPYIYSGSYAGGVQVAPMLALESNMLKNGDTAPNYNMSEATRFRLFIGAQPGDVTSSRAIKWIHTIYVVLSGDPPGDKNGEGGKGDDDGNTTGGGSGNKDGDGDGDTDGKGDGSGNNTNEGDGSGAGDGRTDKTPGGATPSGGRDSTGETGNSDPELGIGSANVGEAVFGVAATAKLLAEELEKDLEKQKAPSDTAKTSRAYNAYRMVDIGDSEIPMSFMRTDTAEPYALPSAAAIFVIGNASALLWFFGQSGKSLLPYALVAVKAKWLIWKIGVLR